LPTTSLEKHLEMVFSPLAMTVGAVGIASAPLVWQRLKLSRAKHRSLAGHAKMAARLARLLPIQRFDLERMLNLDGAPTEIVAQRRRSLDELTAYYTSTFPTSKAMAAEAAETLSDLQFISAYRVPPQFGAVMRERISSSLFLTQSEGVRVQDVDGNWLHDLSGSYGVNVFGYDFYKACIEEANRRVCALGPVLGAYHPIVIDNATRLAALSGLDEVTFHMSGTEAVMQAVRLARYHTRKKKLVRFCGAYHGWWGDVQPGVGNPVPADHTFTLSDMSAKSLAVLATRDDIACVLINPLQALHPNRPAPGDSGLIDSSRTAAYDKAAYTAWLQDLRKVCTEQGIVLIFDEVFLGFRLARGGAQEYFGVQADLVTYGKTLGGGLPIGVVCGHASLMKRYRDSRPADICFARGTFNAHPYVMAAMNAFLVRLDTPEIGNMLKEQDALWNSRSQALNERMAAAGLPVRFANMCSVWTTLYTVPSRFNWLYQYYLRREGLALSWVGSGRYIFSLNYGEAEFAAVADRMVRAAERMREGGWWWHDGVTTNRDIRRSLMLSLIRERLGNVFA
jgi:glutamate-1-semialdehyde 2,1-aminomutase